MKKGPIGGSLKVLCEDDVQRIHAASLALLAEQGMQSESDPILDVFRRGGAQVDGETRVIRVPPDMVDAALKSAPKAFALYGRDPAMDIWLEPGRLYFGMGGTSEPYFWDHDLGLPREPTKADMVNNTRLGQALPNIDFMMALCSAGDVPKEQVLLHEYDALFRNTTKPVIYTSPGRWHTSKFFEMAAAACGGESAFRERPCVVLFTQPVSPLRISRYSEGMFEAAELGVPIMSSPGPMMGATSPATLAGTLVQVNAEALLGIVMAQLIKPGTPVIYAPHTGVMDMVTAQCTYGSPEQSLARAAVAQLGLFYQLPTFGLGGGVEAKLPDAEASAEAMLGMLLNALSGLTLTQTLGTMASGLYGSPEMLLICEEMVHMIKRVMAGIAFTDETLALDVIKEVGYGGTFLKHDHTAFLFRKELFFPVLFRRQTVDRWRERGAKSMTEVAHQRVLDILAKAGPAPLPDGADEALRRALAQAGEEAISAAENA